MTVVSSGWVVSLFVASPGVCGVSFPRIFFAGSLLLLPNLFLSFDVVFGEEVELFLFCDVGGLDVQFYWCSLNVVS